MDIRVLHNVEILRAVIGWTEVWEKELKRKNYPVVEEGSLPSTRVFPLSMIMVWCSLSMKDTASIDMVEVVAGSSYKFVLTKM